MLEPTEHHRGEWVVAGPITNLFSYANTVAYIQSEIAFLQIAGGQEIATNIALPHLLTPVCQEDTYAMPKQANVLASISVSHPKGTLPQRIPIYKFHLIAYIYDSAHLHGRRTLCTQAGDLA